MKKPVKFKPIPPFTSYEEEAQFWDTHSVVKDWDEQTIAEALREQEPEKTAVIHVKVTAKIKKRLAQKAKAQASTISALLRLWVSQKLAEADATSHPGVSR